MKTPDQALTEWTLDEVVFDYCDGRGPLVHNRDQFVKMCKEFEIYDPNTYQEPVAELGTGKFIIGSGAIHSGAIRSGMLGQVHIATGCISTVSPGTATTEAPRDDITKLANWSVLNRIKQVAWLCTDFFSPVMCKPERDVLARVQTMLEPRNVAQFASAKDLLLKLMELSIEHENARNNAN